jgi:transcriptional regulator with XRE-family HTH domain
MAAFERTRKLLGIRLRRLREQRKLTLYQAEELSGLAWTSIWRLETAKTGNVTLASILALARAYEVPIESLFSDTPDKIQS